ncbi:isopenicillin N synthase family dioxygenase [Limoniibacter endophyticus]|uniref:2-oxobutyrate oxidase n=1 Tax=Limoniibacter endophyticus TaxID=1565040 RepID=A0A8J3DGW3_9HYPH|nr:isopenicillin N synthase family oxygenase [Limoniibacter endophyticus]GHC66367.1 2-oxobutyrate oxidase [Limoniibacter endophyticus]
MTRTIPLIDLDDFENAATHANFLEDLRAAARDVGFFYLSGHGISLEEIEEILALTQAFFELPDDDKLMIDMINSPHFRGYTRLGNERTNAGADWREQLDLGIEREALPIAPDSPPYRRLYGPNQWPEHLPQLQPVIENWQAKTERAAIRLLEAFSLALGQERNALANVYCDEPNHRMKLARYPGKTALHSSNQGVGAHKDGGFLTLLLQDDKGGLQVEYDGVWLDAVPVPGTLVVNIGELLELASNGYLRATVHRVIAPPAGTARYSVPFFFSARLDATIPLLELPAHLAREARGPESDPANPLFRNVGENVLKSRLRSHPDVAERYYADVLEKRRTAA